VEVAFYHKPSRSLLVTDAVIYVPREPPECISKGSLLESAKNGLAVRILSGGKEVPNEPVVDNKMNRQKGWWFVCTFSGKLEKCIINHQSHLKAKRCMFSSQDGREWFFKSCSLAHQIC